MRSTPFSAPIEKEVSVDTSSEGTIRAYRREQQNPYACLDQLEELDQLKADRRRLENQYAHANELEALSELVLQPNSVRAGAQPKLQHPHRTGPARESSPQRERRNWIERLAREQHQQIWSKRAILFADHATRRPIDMIDPIIVLELLGYEVETHGALGSMANSDRHASKVAGLIDKTSRKVLLSSGFPIPVRNFTAAHELGHAVMHDFRGMHRDRATDGSLSSRDGVEREADIFASMFLMPRRLVKQEFEARFGRSPFPWNEETRFALGGSLPYERWEPASTRALAQLLSSAAGFNGMNFIPLFKLFRVSEWAMAIRLEELQLVEKHHG